jgi:hypothetical protein
MGGAKAHYDGIVAFAQTDFTGDLKKITVPVLVMHGDDDQIVPYAGSGPLSARLVQNGTLKTLQRIPPRHAGHPGPRRSTLTCWPSRSPDRPGGRAPATALHPAHSDTTGSHPRTEHPVYAALRAGVLMPHTARVRSGRIWLPAAGTCARIIAGAPQFGSSGGVQAQSRRAEPDDRHRVTSIDLTTLSDGADQGERAHSRLYARPALESPCRRCRTQIRMFWAPPPLAASPKFREVW